MDLKFSHSPIVDNWMKQKNKRQQVSSQYIHDVLELKKTVMHDSAKAYSNTLVRREILESWILSRENGIALGAFAYVKQANILSYEETHKLLKKNKTLIEATDAYMSGFETYMCAMNCYLCLTDEKGYILKTYTGQHSATDQMLKESLIIPGALYDESTVGTCPHMLSIRYKVPFQLLAPETYNTEWFQETGGSSAPLFNAEHELIGTITLISESMYQVNSQTLILTIAIRDAIEHLYQSKIMDGSFKEVIGNQSDLKKRIDCSLNTLESSHTFEDIIGQSQVMKMLIQKAQHFSTTHANILIEGESGTGKDLLAQAIHNASNPLGAYVPINCAAIPSELIESELFGYESGAFTGADSKGKIGKLEYASGGTLFLDEIGEMPLTAQAVLLRALDQRVIRRVGGHKAISVDFRLITATNKNLLELVKAGQFRSDLYYRINVLSLETPPLRDRDTDVIVLAKFFLKKLSQTHNVPLCQLSPEVIMALLEHKWPGNIRELENAMTYAFTLSHNNILTLSQLPDPLCKTAKKEPLALQNYKSVTDLNAAVDEDLEMAQIIAHARRMQFNMTQTANALHISRATLYRKIEKYGLLSFFRA